MNTSAALHSFTFALQQTEALVQQMCEAYVRDRRSAGQALEQAPSLLWYSTNCDALARLVETTKCPPGLMDFQQAVVRYITLHRAFGEQLCAGDFVGAAESCTAILTTSESLYALADVLTYMLCAPLN